MKVKFWPSLQIIAYSRVAQGILYTFDIEILKEEFMTSHFEWTNYIRQIKEKISTIILPFHTTFSYFSTQPMKSEEMKHKDMSLEIQNKLAGVVMALGLEVTNWLQWHKTFLEGDNHYLRSRLVWFSFGIIDRFKTAQMYIQDENVCVIYRFLLACKYYFEDDVQTLWKRMSKQDRFYVARNFSRTRSMELWLKIVNTNNSLDWDQISFTDKDFYFIRNYLGIRYYFMKLRDAEARSLSIYSTLTMRTIHRFDLYSCLSRINEDELNDLIINLSNYQWYALFESFLDWPFQNMFLDVVKSFKQHINEDVFHHIIAYILLNKRNTGLQDYYYVDLFVRLWNLMSPQFGSYVKDDEIIYELVNDALSRS